jgi:phosphoenolpyruvate---glycerone phosphotransferase subunit DhaL
MKMPRQKKCLRDACEQMTAHTQELCLLDTGIGDGDHGITVERGFLAAARAIDAYMGESIQELFTVVGEHMAQSMGGAIGPLYGAYWSAFAQALEARELTGDNLGPALMAGCVRVMKLGRANAGDKTVVDAMYPCAQAAMNGTGTLVQRLRLGAEAAMQGAMDTKRMVAKKGRARFLAEKSLEHVDAGAYSFALFMDHWALETALIAKEESSYEEAAK